MTNETLIDAMVEAIAAAVLAKIGQSTINEELDMLRDEMTRVHNRILEITKRQDSLETVVGDNVLDVTKLEMTIEGMSEQLTQDDVAGIVRDTLSDVLSGASISIDI